MNGRVLVMCATRSRPQELQKMIDSVARTTTQADVAFYVDEDQRDQYAGTKGRYRAFMGPRKGPCASLNIMANDMRGYDAYGAMTDDGIFETPGWDRWVIKTAAEFKSGIGAIAPQTVGGVTERMDFPWLTGKWIEAAGSFVPPLMDTYHFSWDVGLQLVGESTQIKFARESEFAISHAEMHPPRTFPGELGVLPEPQTDYGIRVLYAFADGKEVCRWIAVDMRHMIKTLKDAIAEGS